MNIHAIIGVIYPKNPPDFAICKSRSSNRRLRKGRCICLLILEN